MCMRAVREENDLRVTKSLFADIDIGCLTTFLVDATKIFNQFVQPTNKFVYPCPNKDLVQSTVFSSQYIYVCVSVHWMNVCLRFGRYQNRVRPDWNAMCPLKATLNRSICTLRTPHSASFLSRESRMSAARTHVVSRLVGVARVNVGRSHHRRWDFNSCFRIFQYRKASKKDDDE